VTGVDLVGWVSSIVLLLTLGLQVRKQWRSRESSGVSPWLFVGQMAASAGFSLYSYLLGNWVFLSTNLLLLANAVLGEWVTLRNRRSARQRPAEPQAEAEPLTG
jgi:uncharacterized protein with PQ loop repeat